MLAIIGKYFFSFSYKQLNIQIYLFIFSGSKNVDEKKFQRKWNCKQLLFFFFELHSNRIPVYNSFLCTRKKKEKKVFSMTYRRFLKEKCVLEHRV